MDYYLPRLMKKFGMTTTYCDCHTHQNTAAERTDYDSRVPGAGMFRSTFEAYGDLLYRQQRFLPVISEGGMHWLFAGLADGNYATILGAKNPSNLPLIVDFDLLKIHPLQNNLGMGPTPAHFFGHGGSFHDQGNPHNEFFNQYLAAMIAYGHCGGILPSTRKGYQAQWGFSGQFKKYYMMKAIQSLYGVDEVEKIRYEDNGQLVDTSQAIKSDAYKKGRLYVRYKKGLEIFVNYNSKDSWTIEYKGKKYLLPPYGFFASDGKRFLEFSILKDNNRIEYVECPEYIYMDTWGKSMEVGDFTVSGAVAMKKQGNDEWLLIPTDVEVGFESPDTGDFLSVEYLNKHDYSVVRMDKSGELIPKFNENKPGFQKIRIRLSRLYPGRPVKSVQVQALSLDGTLLRTFSSDIANGYISLSPVPRAQRYRLLPRWEK